MASFWQLPQPSGMASMVAAASSLFVTAAPSGNLARSGRPVMASDPGESHGETPTSLRTGGLASMSTRPPARRRGLRPPRGAGGRMGMDLLSLHRFVSKICDKCPIFPFSFLMGIPNFSCCVLMEGRHSSRLNSIY
ncbi:hypothetical protein PAHAL_4G352700 [Panicum hallii]|uniref:Uncharacterized protein n=1 Tax=Panicum hallii TaxID=206008 RepID=A0A2S3HMH5_9POAL|nr:hypothetical protein PAHAL_4G352700 [Panicum hallii]